MLKRICILSFVIFIMTSLCVFAEGDLDDVKDNITQAGSKLVGKEVEMTKLKTSVKTAKIEREIRENNNKIRRIENSIELSYDKKCKKIEKVKQKIAKQEAEIEKLQNKLKAKSK